MAPAKASGYKLTKDDAKLVLGMEARGDRNHDIACWFGVNQGRIKEAKDGAFGTLQAAPSNTLPPKGPPGIKGRRLRTAVEKALSLLQANKVDEARKALEDARTKYDANES